MSGDVKEQATHGYFVPLVAQLYIHTRATLSTQLHIYSLDGDAGMTLKNAALLALIGTILLMALLLWDCVFDFLNLLRGLIPATVVFSSFVYVFASFTVAVFFYVSHRAQS